MKITFDSFSCCIVSMTNSPNVTKILDSRIKFPKRMTCFCMVHLWEGGIDTIRGIWNNFFFQSAK